MTADALILPAGLAVAGGATRSERARGLREDDREAIEACQRGEREAFDRLVERYQRDVYRLCYRYVNNHQDANDMAQEVVPEGLPGHRKLPRRQRVLDLALPDRGEHLPELPGRAPAAAGGAVGARWRTAAPGVAERMEARRALAAGAGGGGAAAREAAGDADPEGLPRPHARGGGAASSASSVGTVKANLFHALGNLRKLLGAQRRRERCASHLTGRRCWSDAARRAWAPPEARAALSGPAPTAARGSSEARVGLALARAAEVPEPSPLYWDAFRRQVGAADREEAPAGAVRSASAVPVRWPTAAAVADRGRPVRSPARDRARPAAARRSRAAGVVGAAAAEEDAGLEVLPGARGATGRTRSTRRCLQRRVAECARG